MVRRETGGYLQYPLPQVSAMVGEVLNGSSKQSVTNGCIIGYCQNVSLWATRFPVPMANVELRILRNLKKQNSSGYQRSITPNPGWNEGTTSVDSQYRTSEHAHEGAQ